MVPLRINLEVPQANTEGKPTFIPLSLQVVAYTKRTLSPEKSSPGVSAFQSAPTTPDLIFLETRYLELHYKKIIKKIG